MSQPIPNADSQRSLPPKTPQVPEFLRSAGIVTKVFFAGLAAVGGIGFLCVGITFTPFSPEFGLGAFGLSTFLFGIAGFLLFNGLTTPPVIPISSRQVAAHS